MNCPNCNKENDPGEFEPGPMFSEYENRLLAKYECVSCGHKNIVEKRIENFSH